MQLDGARVVITGASRGIGEAIARVVAERGARTALVARSEGPLKELAGDLDGIAYPCDLTDTEQVAELVPRIEADGPIDVLVNNAGVNGAGWFPDLAPDEVAAVMQVNLLTPMELCRQVIPRMLERGRGHIVNVSSLAGVAAFPGLSTYSTTKGGLTLFTAGLRADLRGLPIGTTLVELGPIPTDMLDRIDDYQPVGRSFRRFYRVHLLADVPKEQVAADVAHAIERGRKHVRHPKRAVVLALSAEWPRRFVELVLTGVPHREK
jgi:uncharacterized protein